MTNKDLLIYQIQISTIRTVGIFDEILISAAKYGIRAAGNGGNMSRLDVLCNLAEELEENQLKKILANYNDQLKSLVTSGITIGNVDYPKLARQIQYLAVAIAEDKHLQNVQSASKGRATPKASSAKGPAWKDIADAINDICKSRSKQFKKLLPEDVGNERISAFATFKSMANGVTTENFYVAVALYLIHAHDEGEMDRPFFKLAVPQRERVITKALFEDMSAALRSEVVADEGDPNHEITVNFNIKKSNTDNFARYFDQYTFSDDGRLHLIIYRPMRTKPGCLIKTFLSIGRSDEGSQAFGYAHFYEPVDGTDQTRFSGGKVLPMQNGLYLAGGQKPQVIDGRTDQPFHSLKTMAFRWTDLNNNLSLLPGLVMSTNFTGQQLVSRIAARVTPIPRSDKVELREVANKDLVKNLSADLAIESTLIIQASEDKSMYHENGGNFPQRTKDSDVKSLAGRILAHTNNQPTPNSGVSVPQGYFHQVGKKSAPLSNSRLATIIEEAFNNKDQSCKDKDGNPYDFWADTRFGPLVIP